MKALLLAAGFGTRLRPISFFYPKPTLPVLGKPILHYLFDFLLDFNIKDIAINLHYLKEKVKNCFYTYPHCDKFKVFFSEEFPEILLTAGAIKKCEEFLKDDYFFVINAKIITNINLEELEYFHKKKGNIATIVVKPNPDLKKYPFSNVIFGKDKLLGFDKPSPDKKNYFFTGVQIFSPDVFKYIPQNKPLHTTNFLFPELIKRGEKVGVLVDTSSYWFEFSTPERYFNNSFELFDENDMFNIAGENLNVGNGSFIRRCILGNNIKVEENVQIENSIIFGDNFLGNESRIKNSIILNGIGIEKLSIENRILTLLPIRELIKKEYELRKGEEIIYGRYLSRELNF